jgi:hypothetical protein
LVLYIKRRLHDFGTFCSVATGTPDSEKSRLLCGCHSDFH